jgi:hypothetical protein
MRTTRIFATATAALAVSAAAVLGTAAPAAAHSAAGSDGDTSVFKGKWACLWSPSFFDTPITIVVGSEGETTAEAEGAEAEC